MVLSETLTILPSPSAVVEQYQPLTLHCFYSGNQNVVIVTWNLDDQEVAGFSQGTNETCIPFSGSVDNNLYQYSCGTQPTITIRNVTEERHAEKWSCRVYSGAQFLSSTSTFVFVQGKLNFKVVICGKYRKLYKTLKIMIKHESFRHLIFVVLYSLEYKQESHGV